MHYSKQEVVGSNPVFPPANTREIIENTQCFIDTSVKIKNKSNTFDTTVWKYPLNYYRENAKFPGMFINII